MPASSAAQNGCSRGLVLYLAKVRRRTAPTAALATMSKIAATCWTPKITDSDAAPAAAATVNSQAGADLLDCPHGGSHTIHIHTGGIGLLDGEQSGTPFFGVKLQ